MAPKQIQTKGSFQTLTAQQEEELLAAAPKLYANRHDGKTPFSRIGFDIPSQWFYEVLLLSQKLEQELTEEYVGMLQVTMKWGQLRLTPLPASNRMLELINECSLSLSKKCVVCGSIAHQMGPRGHLLGNIERRYLCPEHME